MKQLFKNIKKSATFFYRQIFKRNGRFVVSKTNGLYMYEIFNFSDRIWFADVDSILHFKNGKLHREDGPAVECHFVKVWFENGLPRTKDGPWIVFDSGVIIHSHIQPKPFMQFPCGFKKYVDPYGHDITEQEHLREYKPTS